MRSLTPSERWNTEEDDELRSPLSKRKKIAAERSGTSKLKETLIAADDGDDNEDNPPANPSQPGTPRTMGGNDDEDDEDDDDDDDEMDGTTDGEVDDEDDFLARELEEDWG